MAFHIEPDLYDVMVLNLVNGVHTAGRWAQPLEQLGAGWHTSNAMLHAIPFHRPNIYVGFRDLKVPKEGGPPFRSVVVAVVYHHVAPNTFHIVGGFRLPTAWLNMARTQLPRYAPAFKFEGHRYHLQGFIKLD
ncbi:hypothetical protein BCV70DRAFT_13811 [Testicularia cyperi]|uniref:Uncharacterized protein n=1 Tax=Testicularia cyperi TaxID=1882483 RepID=A0A317Y112_9BASI|nr:hypothetical protein BCV70DRAFT_13811 [Testicularia cyperi]